MATAHPPKTNAKRVSRKDYSWEALALPQKNGAGLLRVEGFLTRSGVFAYTQEDGSVIKEWRPPDEVSDPTSMDSLRLAPVTIDHPKESVTIDNYKDLACGTVGDGLAAEMMWPDPAPPDDDSRRPPPNVRLRAKLAVHDSALIAKIEAKELKELSCGYTADLEMVAGVTPDGEAYDAVQRRIAYNHVAFVDAGRQGPGIAVRVDRKDNKPPANPAQETPMQKLVINGVTFEVSPQVAEAIMAERGAHTKALADAVDNVGKQTARADVAEKKAGEEAARADAATAKEKEAQKEKEKLASLVKEGVKARAGLLNTALSVMGKDEFEAAKLDEADDDDIRGAVIKHRELGADIDAKVAAAKKGDIGASSYLGALWDVAIKHDADDDVEDDRKNTTADSAGSLRRRSAKADANDVATKADAARQAAIDKKSNAWKPKSA